MTTITMTFTPDRVDLDFTPAPDLDRHLADGFTGPVGRRALEIAEGDVSRIEVLSETCMIIHNDGGWRAR